MSVSFYCELGEFIYTARNGQSYGKYSYQGLFNNITRIYLKTKEKTYGMLFGIKHEKTDKCVKKGTTNLEINIIYSDELDLTLTKVMGVCDIRCYVNDVNNIRNISLSDPTTNVVKYFEYLSISYENCHDTLWY
uniref:ORFan n=1 Tax=Parastrongyloides trichosuri TaxID=131310 RepID=A0A0N4Z516_PARTI